MAQDEWDYLPEELKSLATEAIEKYQDPEKAWEFMRQRLSANPSLNQKCIGHIMNLGRMWMDRN